MYQYLVNHKNLQYFVIIALSILILGCDISPGDEDEEENNNNPDDNTPVIVITAPTDISLIVTAKQLQFTWTASQDTDHYRILENPDGSSGFSVIDSASNITSTNHTLEISAHRTNWLSAQYIIEACDSSESDCVASDPVNLTPSDSIAASLYIKASNADSGDWFGGAIAISGDGRTLAVGARLEDSNATGIGGDQTNQSASASGAVYIYTQSGSTWTQQAYIKASNTNTTDWFGDYLALSEDGNTLAVSAPLEDSDATGINGDQSDNSASDAGAVYIYSRTGATWLQQAYIKASNTGSADGFGSSVALSSDGNTLAVGAYFEDSSATGINGDQNDNSTRESGAVYIYTRNGSSWSQQAYIKASNPGMFYYFGVATALSSDGNTLAVGSYYEASAATGINGNQLDTSASTSGAVYIYTRNSNNWAQQAYIKASNTDSGDRFGLFIDLNGDGNTLAVGAFGESSVTSNINGDQSDNTAPAAGAVYIYQRTGVNWAQHAYIKAPNTDSGDNLGPVSLSSDGLLLAIGAYDEASTANGIYGDQTDNSAFGAGAAYIYEQSAGSWQHRNYIKASNSDAHDRFSYNVALCSDGTTLAISAYRESSSAIEIAGDQNDNSAPEAGAVYIY